MAELPDQLLARCPEKHSLIVESESGLSLQPAAPLAAFQLTGRRPYIRAVIFLKVLTASNKNLAQKQEMSSDKIAAPALLLLCVSSLAVSAKERSFSLGQFQKRAVMWCYFASKSPKLTALKYQAALVFVSVRAT
jgi:hypothetical protein